MKRKSQRYLGMTGSQIGILAGLLCLAMLSIVGLLWLVTSTTTVPADVTTSVPVAPTETPSATETAANPDGVVPTSTPTPTSAAVATIAPPEGWVEFKTRGAGIWLPKSFVGGDMLDRRSETIQSINRLGTWYLNVVKALKASPKSLVLYMVDRNLTQTNVITTVSLQHLASTEDVTIDQYIQNDLNSDVNGTPLAAFIIINATKKMSLLGREARQLTYTQRRSGFETTGLFYYIKDGNDFWALDYSLAPKDYPDLLPMVEQSVHTFNLVK